MSLYDEDSIAFFQKSVDWGNVRTWPYFPIVMPLREDGTGPASYQECHRITWEVWDNYCGSHGVFDYLPDAINEAIRLTREMLEDEDSVS